MKNIQRAALRLAIAAAWLAGAASSFAQAYPEKPIRILVPFAAGGVTDALVRLLQDPVGKSLGQPVVVENRAGAAGAIAARAVSESKPDGYTFLVVNTGLVAITPHAQKNPGFDPLKTLMPVAGLSSAPSVLLVNGALPVSDVKGFIEHARTHPRAIDYAVIGKGAYGDLATSLFAQQARIEMVPVPYQGNAQSTTALLTGEVKAQLTILSGAMNDYIRSGRIKALGVATLGPSPLVPGVAPIADVLPGFEAVVITGLMAPAGTPAAIVDKVSLAITTALRDPALQKRLNGMGMESAPMDAAAYGERVRSEIAAFAPAVRELTPE